MTQKPRIALACQGGGSQTAFTAGALKGLCEAGVGEDFEVVSISGTSGGALCASLLWFAFEKGEKPLWGRLMKFWEDNTAQTWVEQAVNKMVVDSIRLTNSGKLPTLHFSPSSPLLQQMMPFMTLGQRENFTNFRALLETHIDFDEIASWGPRARPPVLMVGAANVNTGALAKFISNVEPIRVEHLLASCAVPSIFPAVRIGEDVYWDGLFSDNPPVEALVRASSVGAANLPDEIWLIKINSTSYEGVPERPDDITDRRNQLDGNISLFQQLRHMEMLNDILLMDGFRPEYLAQFDIKRPIRFPKSFVTDADKPYHIPFIEMEPELQKTLDYEGKIDRSPANINMLIAEGEKSAKRFLRERAALDAKAPVKRRNK